MDNTSKEQMLMNVAQYIYVKRNFTVTHNITSLPYQEEKIASSYNPRK